MTLGERNNNPLNIRKVPGVRWKGEILPLKGDGGSFVRFESIEWGIRAALKILGTYRDKYAATSIREIVSRWAPPAENNTEAYIATVCRLTGFGGNEKLGEKQWPALVKAMAVVESGLSISDETIAAAHKLM
jgi:hypothetical protein